MFKRTSVRYLLLILAAVVLGGCNPFGPAGPQPLYEERFPQAEGNT